MIVENAQELIENFLDNFFCDEIEAVQVGLDFLDESGFQETKIDYIKLRRFMNTAVNNLKNLDSDILSGLTGKLYKDIEYTSEYYREFIKRSGVKKIIYKRDFLPSIPQYKRLADDITVTDGLKSRYYTIAKSTEQELAVAQPPKTEDELKKVKLLKKRNVDAIYNFGKAKEKLVVLNAEMKELEESLSSEFEIKYDEFIQEVKDGFEEIINTKSYYFDKFFWKKSEESKPIRKFFDDSRIVGDFSTRTYIKYYLRNIDVEKSKTSDWHTYLHDVLKVLE